MTPIYHFPFSTGLHNRVEMLEFGSFTCPQSRSTRKLIDTVLDLFRDQLTYTFHHYPGCQDDHSLLASVAAEAAKRQGKFWPMFHGLYSLKTISLPTISTLALDIGLDQQQFLHDLLDDRLHNFIKADYLAGANLGVNRTPTVFVGGQQFHGKITMARLSPLIQHHVGLNRKAVIGSVDRRTGLIDWGESGLW
ncbi:DsbA family protein [Larkinella insperata]|uniref:DsbA family protein n=1 Tax=Larkinella insperata TaxID=332158 RepID=A0ABW3Q2P0_9BACT